MVRRFRDDKIFNFKRVAKYLFYFKIKLKILKKNLNQL